jgi:hypothetical protein
MFCMLYDTGYDCLAACLHKLLVLPHFPATFMFIILFQIFSLLFLKHVHAVLLLFVNLPSKVFTFKLSLIFSVSYSHHAVYNI